MVRQDVLSYVVGISIVVFGVFLALRQTNSIPKHMLNHTVTYEKDLIDVDTAKALLILAKEMRRYPTNAADTKFVVTTREHIGENTSIVNGRCDSHRYLIPSPVTGDQCILPGRIDIARHFVQTGGTDGLKEDIEKLLTRTQSFGRYMTNVTDYPVAVKLFQQEKFQTLAKKTCPSHKQHIDPFQFNYIIQLPGQVVPMHIDGAYFWGATRHQFPQWLLAVMVGSGLFQDKFVNQVQVVGYLHEWDLSSKKDGGDVGEFVYWKSNDNEPEVVLPTPRAGTAVDGSKTVHAANVYQQHLSIPTIDKNNETLLVYKGDPEEDNGVWTLSSNGHFARNYTTSDLRISIVYRAFCFESEDESKKFRQDPTDKTTMGGPVEDQMELDAILSILAEQLVKRNKYDSVDAVLSAPRMELIELLLDEFVPYPQPPLSKSLFPLNYCALKSLVGPRLQFLFSLIC